MFLPIVAWVARTSDRGENEKGLRSALPGVRSSRRPSLGQGWQFPR